MSGQLASSYPERQENRSFQYAEVAKRTTAPVLKTGSATRYGSSNLSLSVDIFLVSSKIVFLRNYFFNELRHFSEQIK